MITCRRFAVFALMVSLTACAVWSVPAGEPAKAKDDPQAVIKQGDYLVNTVARCGDCHTPRDDAGKLDMTKNLQGATIPFQPINKKGQWNGRAPDITMSGKASKWTEDRMVKFFSTGQKAEAPMPAYKLTKEDAVAVTAYLRSLPGKAKAEAPKEEKKTEEAPK